MGWNLACRDWKDRLRDGRTLIPDLPIDRRLGDRAVAVFNKLRLADVPGTPTMAEAGADWFRDIVRALFGSQNPETHARAIRELFCLVPKKNSKTTNGALLMLTALLLNERPNASCIMTAPVQDVATLAFEAAAGAIALDNVLNAKLHVREHLKTIVHRETKAELQIMTFDPSVLTGQKPVYALIDELHVVAKMRKAASAVRQIRGGMLPYPEGFLAFITTQSEEPPSGVFAAELTKARAIRDGEQEGSMLPVLYEFPREMQESYEVWSDTDNWPMVTPNNGKSITVERLAEEFQTAKNTSEEELRAWASQHLNIEIGVALGTGAWAGASFWEENAEEFTLAEFFARCEVVTPGIDGGGLDDMLGLTLVGREKGTGKWITWSRAWIHPIALKRRLKEAARYYDFEKDGDLVIVENVGEDVQQVGDIIDQCEKASVLERIGVDQAGIGSIVDEIVSRGISEDRIVGIPQGWRMVGAIKTAERKLAAGQMIHAKSRLMDWCIGNAKVEPQGNALVITKQVSGSAKIDPVLAMLNGVTLMSLNPQAATKNFDIAWA